MIHYRNNGYTLEGISLDPSAPAFRYGAGFFETLYYNGRDVCHLDMHLDRILHSLRSYDIPYTTVDFEEVIHQILNRNGLEKQTARVNIFYPIETEAASPVITAAPHDPKPYKAYRLCVCKDRHVSTLNGQKTTNYMFFHLAMRRAKSRGFDDAALFDLEDNLLEAATGALVLQKEGQFVCVDSPYRLPSTALALAREVLDILPVRLPMEELTSFRHAYILNSVIGMRPVVSIGETAFVPNDDPCKEVMQLVLGDVES
ncbi:MULTISPECIES: aminotransferase class IV [unclassified Pseudodesulfovibrio]|uniref:aminotransferase class IV n=1 Tax=unclassified Pseudodesulfovibrio TaxID=2661612 RepID=UPI000FEB60CF|nr:MULTISPECIES: aminotransferase class IV [unclassified Pseudodesulfovibrio]MCJ2165135.1 aminotransferase class IV [Pseudodesulfovibrio sp. S3-i]RWU03409.1 aminotransferase IV [Pseudodesulfovibrio sp. S3]